MPKKKVVKKIKKVSKPIKAKKEKLVGTITHYYGEIKVGVIKLKDILKNGDTIHVVGGEDTDFKQPIKSMQINHKVVSRAKKGQMIGLKMSKQVREGYKVWK